MLVLDIPHTWGDLRAVRAGALARVFHARSQTFKILVEAVALHQTYADWAFEETTTTALHVSFIV